jgi:hypothetical protein
LAARRLTMRRLREILRLSLEGGLPQRAVAEALGIGTGTVSEYLGRARVAGVGWPIPEELQDDDKLETRVFGPKKEGDNGRRVLDVAFVHEELRRPGVTLSLLWQRLATDSSIAATIGSPMWVSSIDTAVIPSRLNGIETAGKLTVLGQPLNARRSASSPTSSDVRSQSRFSFCAFVSGPFHEFGKKAAVFFQVRRS